MPRIRSSRAAFVILMSALSGGGLVKAQGVTSAAPSPEARSANSVLEIRATRHASDQDEVFLMQRGVPDGWHGKVFVAFRNVSRSAVRIVDEHWFYDYSIEFVDSSGKLVEPAKKWRASNENTSGVVPHATVTNLLPGETHVDVINLAEAYSIKPTDSYTIKIRRRHGLPTKDAAGVPLPDPDLACSLTIAGSASK